MRTEFARLKAAVSSRNDLRSVSTVVDLALELNKEESDRQDFPTILKLLDWILAIPLTNAGTTIVLCFLATLVLDAERDFSKLKIIKTRLRSSMKETTLGRLLQISINGPSMDGFDFDGCAAAFCSAKKRRMNL